MFFLVFSAVTAGVAGLIFFTYYLKRGQFDDIEDIKYQMFRDSREQGSSDAD